MISLTKKVNVKALLSAIRYSSTDPLSFKSKTIDTRNGIEKSPLRDLYNAVAGID